MTEPNVDPNAEPTPDPNAAEEAELTAEVSALAVDDGKGNKMVPLSALMGTKKELRALNKRVKDLEPVAARVTDVDARLAKVAPIINAVLTDPAIAAAVTKKTNPSAATTDQPTDDPDARELAETYGWYTDAGELDIARGQRAIKVQERISERSAGKVVAPFANVTVGSAAEQNLRAAISATDDNGTPLASEESIRELASALPAHLLANPEVMNLVVNNAIGVDRRKGRTPKAAEEPLVLDTVGGRRGAGQPVLTGDERARLTRLGLTEKEYMESVKKLEDGAANRRSIALGR